jgi:hypothetical protein
MLRLFKTAEDGNDEDVVREITDQVALKVISELNPMAERMSAAELRGYARARSVGLIRQEFQTAVREPCSAEKRKELEARVSERTVHAVVRCFAAGPISALPRPHVWMRKAA